MWEKATIILLRLVEIARKHCSTRKTAVELTRQMEPGPPFLRICMYTQCGHGRHSHPEFPARDTACHKCRKRGHFGAQCFSKLKNLLELKQGASVWTGSRLPVDCDTDDIDSGFLDTVSETTGQTAWVVPVFVCKQILDFKVHTGAEVTLFSLTGNCVVQNVQREQDA